MSMSIYDIREQKSKTSKSLSLKELESKYKSFIEEAYNVMQTDSCLSDFLYFEASKLKQRILSIKNSDANHFDAAF